VKSHLLAGLAMTTLLVGAENAADIAGVKEWEWMVGGGIEYALANGWTSRLEYDHIETPGTSVPFPTVALINIQDISVRKWIDVVKLGVNYRFDWSPFAGML
jgi:opacity protein-like surface antigen